MPSLHSKAMAYNERILNERIEDAKDPDTAPHVLDELADLHGELDGQVRYWVAPNPSTPAAALERLAADPDMHVRRGVAYNPSTPVHKKLAADKHPDVLDAVARNPSTPAQVRNGFGTFGTGSRRQAPCCAGRGRPCAGTDPLNRDRRPRSSHIPGSSPCHSCGAEHYPVAGPDRPCPGAMIGGTVFHGDRCACGSPTETVAGYDPDPDGVTDTGRATVCARSGNLLGAAVPPDRCVCGGPRQRPHDQRNRRPAQPAAG